MRVFSMFFSGMLAALPLIHAQSPIKALLPDSDHDGLSDTFEEALLLRFEPSFFVSRDDCSKRPARFESGVVIPTVAEDDGTIYGQAFRRKGETTGPEIELHYYHLWRTDCGRMSHLLDTEHVAVLLRGSGEDAANWRALYWYAAAHEDTICDASQVTRASTIHAEDRGAKVWISEGKHASYLDEELCKHGCGGDRCEHMVSMHSNLLAIGEADAPMNGSVWIHSPNWPLAEKMTRSDFRPMLLNRIDELPDTDIAWAEPSKRPAQAAILGGNRALDGTIIGGNAAGVGLSVGNRDTDTAISLAGQKSKNALGQSFHAVGTALGIAKRRTAEALGSSRNAVSRQ